MAVSAASGTHWAGGGAAARRAVHPPPRPQRPPRRSQQRQSRVSVPPAMEDRGRQSRGPCHRRGGRGGGGEERGCGRGGGRGGMAALASIGGSCSSTYARAWKRLCTLLLLYAHTARTAAGWSGGGRAAVAPPRHARWRCASIPQIWLITHERCTPSCRLWPTFQVVPPEATQFFVARLAIQETRFGLPSPSYPRPARGGTVGWVGARAPQPRRAGPARGGVVCLIVCMYSRAGRSAFNAPPGRGREGGGALCAGARGGGVCALCSGRAEGGGHRHLWRGVPPQRAPPGGGRDASLHARASAPRGVRACDHLDRLPAVAQWRRAATAVASLAAG